MAAAAGVLLTTGAAVLRYRAIDEQPYQVYKGLISAGPSSPGWSSSGCCPADARAGGACASSASG